MFDKIRKFGSTKSDYMNKTEKQGEKKLSENRPPLSEEEAEKIHKDMEMINKARAEQAKSQIITERVPDWARSDHSQSYSISTVKTKYVFSNKEDEEKFNSMSNDDIQKGRFFAELSKQGKVKKVRIDE